MEKYNGKYVTIMLCSQCNNNCKHCYVKYDGMFTDEQLAKFMPTLTKNYIVLLNGTEPILFPEYFKYFKMANEHRILTNGIEILRNPNVMNQLLENEINEVWLSYHFGIQDDLSSISILQLNNVVDMLKQNGFIIKLLCSLSTHNYNNITDFCNNAIELGVNKIKFTNFISQGHAKDNFINQEFLNQDQINQVLGEIDSLRLIIPKDKLVIQRCGTFGPNPNKNNFSCLAGNDMIVLTPNKKIYSCVFDISSESCIGYMDDNNNLIIQKNNMYRDKSYCKVLKKYNGVGK